MALSAIDDSGRPVDWWFMYKVAGKSTTSSGARGPRLRGHKVTGAEYLYLDARAPRTARLALSPHTVDGSGALPNTLNQIYGASSHELGWFFYNDEDPITGKVNDERGHAKGVLAFDLASNTAFWLIQSTPKFPPKDEYSFPRTGLPNAQTFLCITLADAEVARSIARQMYVTHHPNVYLASEIPASLAGQPNDARVRLMQDQVASGNTPVHVVIPFVSRGGVKFLSIAKNKYWGLDFYNDLVGPTLHQQLDVETWEHDPVPPSRDVDQHTVVAMQEVNLEPLGIDLAWSREVDHAKIAISAKSEEVRYVCVGDLNYTMAQRKRGGGTVAFQSEALWASLSSILEEVSELSGIAGARAYRRRAATTATSRARRATAGRRR
ncbi:MAG TPA: deoxyribonuclease II family protein [Kofleriaceae bacterium]|nr:deoxyribonuclease II family protein [Kofleriaceae bacterium]